MIDPKNIQEIIQNVINELPPGLKNMPADLDKNFKSALQSVFEKLDLVTREEFDAQCAVLHRTREKLEMLEKKLVEWEQK
jgi:BMFP domain-containing protein YqiC